MAEEKKKNILFEILNALFNDKEYINNLTNETIKQNIFMINRRLAIKYPLQAQVFNNSKINPIDLLKFWSDFLYTGGRAPGWLYIAGANKSQAKKDAKKLVSSSLIREYCNYYKVSDKDVDAAIKFFPEEMLSDLKEFESFYKELKNNYVEVNY